MGPTVVDPVMSDDRSRGVEFEGIDPDDLDAAGAVV